MFTNYFIFCLYSSSVIPVVVVIVVVVVIESTGVPFLESEEGIAYIPPFRSLRLRNILTDGASVNILESDGIVPQSKPHPFIKPHPLIDYYYSEWLLPLYREQWLKMILVEQRMDSG